MALSDWLNRHLQFDDGEDYGKLTAVGAASAAPQPGTHQPDDICKTDRRNIAAWLTWAADTIERQGATDNLTYNRLRMMRNLVRKWQRQEKQE